MTSAYKLFSVLVVIVGIFGFVLSLDCTTCNSFISWEDCNKTAQVKTCTLAGVNKIHAVLVQGSNPTLDQGTADDTFQCFAGHANVTETASGKSMEVFARDCTFSRTKFCQGWADNVTVIECGTNTAGDVVLGGGAAGLYAYWMLIVAGLVAVKLMM